MKKSLLFIALTSVMGTASLAQQGLRESVNPGTPDILLMDGSAAGSTASKETWLSDTLSLVNQSAQANGPYQNLNFDFASPLDSGKLYGMSIAGYKGFAELFRINGINGSAPVDSHYNMLGIVSRWHGTKSASSTKSVTLSVWKRNMSAKNAVAGRPKFFISGTPEATPVKTQVLNFTQINTNGSPTISYFPAPLTNVTYDAWVGYTVNYTWGSLGGDTIGLSSTQAYNQPTAVLETATLDTLVTVSNIVQESGGAWKSMRYDVGVGNGGEQVIFPIIRIFTQVGMKGVSVRDMTFFGNYPNPANNNTNIRVALKNTADITIEVLDATGKTVQTIKRTGVSGEQIVTVETSNLPAGNYVYTIETSKGERIASVMTVSH